MTCQSTIVSKRESSVEQLFKQHRPPILYLRKLDVCSMAEIGSLGCGLRIRESELSAYTAAFLSPAIPCRWLPGIEDMICTRASAVAKPHSTL
jgi:hypothetical protein